MSAPLSLATAATLPHTHSTLRNGMRSTAMGYGSDRGATVRSVERGLAILQAMNRRPVSSVDYLHKTTRLPKPTLVRLLHTMVKAGYLTNDVRQGGYQLASLVTSLSCGFHG